MFFISFLFFFVLPGPDGGRGGVEGGAYRAYSLSLAFCIIVLHFEFHRSTTVDNRRQTERRRFIVRTPGRIHLVFHYRGYLHLF